MALKYVVVEQKIGNGEYQKVSTDNDDKFEAENQYYYAMWYNGQDENCSEYTVTMQGPMGEQYYSAHRVRPVEPPVPEMPEEPEEAEEE